jgi:hypothetical protein
MFWSRSLQWRSSKLLKIIKKGRTRPTQDYERIFMDSDGTEPPAYMCNAQA